MSRCGGEYSVELGRIHETGKVFDFKYDFYDDRYRCEFENKFINHYYFDEIGFETVGRFKRALKAHLDLKMPYYSKLYETELAAEDLDFLLNKDLKETFLRTVDTEDNLNGNVNQNGSSNSNNQTDTHTSRRLEERNNIIMNSAVEKDNTNKTSNVADGVASASLETGLLTSVSNDHANDTGKEWGDNNTFTDDNTGVKDVSSGSTSNNSNTNTTENKNGKLVEKTELISQGNIGVTSSAELLEKWRKVIINLDEMIILECRDLFMGIY